MKNFTLEPRSAWDELMDLLRESGARVTFDSGRNINHPCTYCAAPGPHKLADLGRYYNGDTLTRPVCERCWPLVELRGARPQEPTP